MAAANTRICDTLLPQLAIEFSVPIPKAAMAVTAFTFAYGLFQLAYGGIGARFGPYRTAVWALALSTTGTFACALAPDLFWLSLARFWSGLTIAAVIPMSMVYIGETVAYADRQPVIARFLLGQVIGVIFGQAFAGLFAEWLNWRQLFFALGLVSSAATLALFLESFSGRVQTHTRPQIIPNLAIQYVRILRIPWARAVLITVLLEGFICFGAFPFIAAFLHQDMNLSHLSIGLIMSGLGIGGLGYIVAVGPLHRFFGESGLIHWGGLMLALGFMLIAVSQFWPFAALGSLLIGLGYYMFHNTLQTNATQMAPFDRSAALALFAFGLFFGQAMGATFIGFMSGFVGYRELFVLSAIGLLLLSQLFKRARLRSRIETSNS